MTKGWLDDWNDDYCCEEHSPGKATQIELAWEQRRNERTVPDDSVWIEHQQRLQHQEDDEIARLCADEEMMTRPISEVAADIKKDWKKVYFGAVPYLEAMMGLRGIEGNYGADSARSIVTYFLSNASGFRGEKAKLLKAELKEMIR